MSNQCSVRRIVLTSVSVVVASVLAFMFGSLCRASGPGKQAGAKEDAPERLTRRPAKSVEQQLAILHRRRATSNITGSFDSFTSYLYAFNDMCLHTHDAQVNAIRLNGVFPKSYKCTNAELFETIARQTKSTMKYDASTDFWTFDPPAMPLPFKIAVPDGWKADNRGTYVSYAPKIAPVGIDVYMVGHYSGLNNAQLATTRDELAAQYGKMANPQLSGTDLMKKVKVDGADALYLETPVPRPNTTLRQWVFIKDGQGYVIVSVIDTKNEAAILPSVEKMLASFKLVTPAPASPGI